MNTSLSGGISVKPLLALPATTMLTRKIPARDGQLCPAPTGTMQNDLLASLPASELGVLLPHLESVQLPFDMQLHDQGSTFSHVYFPTSAIIVLVYLLGDGHMIEVGVTGREGVMGVSILMGDRSPGTARVQSAGHAYKLKASMLKEASAGCATLQHLLIRYMHALFTQIVQCSVCGHHYSIEQQLSRWLLDRLDRLQTDELRATQEMIANMLGVRRETVTEAAGRLRQSGIIQYRRGRIVVLDRGGLEATAGECYKSAKHEIDLLRTRSTTNPTTSTRDKWRSIGERQVGF